MSTNSKLILLNYREELQGCLIKKLEEYCKAHKRPMYPAQVSGSQKMDVVVIYHECRIILASSKDVDSISIRTKSFPSRRPLQTISIQIFLKVV